MLSIRDEGRVAPDGGPRCRGAGGARGRRREWQSSGMSTPAPPLRKAALPRELARARVRRGAVRAQLLGRLDGDEACRAHPSPVQPVLPDRGLHRAGGVDHLEGHGDPGDVREGADLCRLEAVQALPNRDSRVRGHEGALAAARTQARRRQRPAADDEHAVVGERAGRIRADDPLRRPPLLVDAPRGQRAGHARRVRPFAGAPLPAVGRAGDVRRRRRDRRGEGRALGGRRLPAPA